MFPLTDQTCESAGSILVIGAERKNRRTEFRFRSILFHSLHTNGKDMNPFSPTGIYPTPRDVEMKHEAVFNVACPYAWATLPLDVSTFTLTWISTNPFSLGHRGSYWQRVWIAVIRHPWNIFCELSEDRTTREEELILHNDPNWKPKEHHQHNPTHISL